MKQYVLLVMTLLGVNLACGEHHEASQLDIINGTKVEVSSAEAKSTVAVITPHGRSFCSGVLISPTKVLTAAHCIKNVPNLFDRIYVGFKLHHRYGHFDPEASVEVETYTMHPEYDPEFTSNTDESVPPSDIAMLELVDSAPDSHSPAISLESTVSVGEAITVAGYGERNRNRRGGKRSGELYKVGLKVTDLYPDRKEFRFNSPRQHPRAACYGDSGGPVYVYRQGALVLGGLVSWGSEKCTGRELALTDITRFADWIDSF